MMTLLATALTGLALGVPGALAWWLYRSPLAGGPPEPDRLTPAFRGLLLLALAGASLCQIVGALWDASQHIRTGVIPAGADFLWPPHLLLYSGFLWALLATALGLGALWRAGDRQSDPRRLVRQQPALGAVVLASLYALLAIPGDALWHALFGPDLTAWSPPHLLLAGAAATVVAAAVALLAPVGARAGPTPGFLIAAASLLALALQTALLVAVLEWELPVRPAVVQARPFWLYLTLVGLLGLVVCVLARALGAGRWSATVVALAFLGLRTALSGGLALAGQIVPAFPPPFLLGAVGLDLVARLAGRPGWGPALRGALVFAVGYLLLAVPVLSGRSGSPPLTLRDLVLTALALVGAGSLLLRLVPQRRLAD